MNIKPTDYSLTEKGKIEHTLDIVDTPITLNKKRALYQLLLFFEFYKRNNIISKRRLNNFLKEIGISFEKLKRVNQEKSKMMQKEISYFNITPIVYKTFNNIEIVEFKQTQNSKCYYYIVLPGFSIEEFLIYLQLLKNNKEPRPFAKFPTNIQIPYIYFQNFSPEEVYDAIKSLRNNNIIKPIKDVFSGESRYDIFNESLKELLYYYWTLHILDFHLTHMRLLYYNKPLDIDKKHLELYLGNKKKEHLLAFIHDYKKQHNKDLEKERNKNFKNIKKTERERNKILKIIQERSKAIIKNEKDKFIISLINNICLPQDENIK